MSYTLVRGRVARVTKLDGCGARVLGPKSTVVTNGFTTIALTAQTTQGDAISVTNANGAVCISDTPAPVFTGYAINITFCQVDPELYSLMTGQPIVYAFDGTTVVGFNIQSDISLVGSGFALEVWSTVPSAACAGGNAQYGYSIFPFCQGGVLGDFTIENAAVTFQISGATTLDGTPWGVGPYNVVAGSGGVAAPLNTALSTKNHYHQELTTIAPPSTLGTSALGVPATLITAGIPATLSPALAYPPQTFATIGSVTKSPTTAWTTGQYVLLGDGSKAYWNSTAWVVGTAP